MIKKFKAAIAALLCVSVLTPAALIPTSAETKPTNGATLSWQEAIYEARQEFKDGGGYYTWIKDPFNRAGTGAATNAWEGMDMAYQIGENDSQPVIDVSKARPSFCSSATYMLLVRAIQLWNNNRNVISRDAWVNMKPITWPFAQHEDDGYGCFGRCNANGAGVACFIKDVNAGKNYYVGNRSEYATEKDYLNAWSQGKYGDFMKIFWNSGIGCDNNNPVGDESGHSVLFLGRQEAYNPVDGSRDDIITYWSSNGSGTNETMGYGVQTTRMSKIYRCVFTDITNPENFNNAKSIGYDNVNEYCSYLNGGGHGTVASLKASIGYVDPAVVTPAAKPAASAAVSTNTDTKETASTDKKVANPKTGL